MEFESCLTTTFISPVTNPDRINTILATPVRNARVIAQARRR